MKNAIFLLMLLAVLLPISAFSQTDIDNEAIDLMGTSVVVVTSVVTCCPVDIHALASNPHFSGATISGDFVYFDRTLSYFLADSCYWDFRCWPRHAIRGFDDTIIIRFVIHRDGNIYAGVYDLNQALLMLADRALEPASTWGRPLMPDDVLTDPFIALDYSQNTFGFLLQYLYAELTDYGLMDLDCHLHTLRDRLCYDGPADSSGIAVYGFNLLDFSIYANTEKPIWVLSSMITYLPLNFVYSAGCWYAGLYTYEGPNALMNMELNRIWCARCDDSLGGSAIGSQSRGFGIRYVNPIAGAIRSTGGSNGGTSAYSYLNGAVAMSIVNCCTRDYASANYFNFGFYPDSVRLVTNNTTSTQRGISSRYRMAVVADSVWTTDIWQTPSPGYSSNPPPLLLKINPGWNTVPRADMTLHTSDTINVGTICAEDTFYITVPISNTGDDMLVITTVQLSDTINAGAIYNSRIPPHSSDSVLFWLNYPMADTGYFNINVSFFTNDKCEPLVYLNIHGYAESCVICTTTVDSVWFWQETNCNDSNIVNVCYTLTSTCPDSVFSISFDVSSDSGATWTVPTHTLIGASDAVGDRVRPGTHCFQWVLSSDMFGVEGHNWKVKIRTFAMLDTFSILDSIDISHNPRFGNGLAFGDGFFWIYDFSNGFIYKTECITCPPVDSIFIGASFNCDIHYDDGKIYFGSDGSRPEVINVIDVATGVRDTIAIMPTYDSGIQGIVVVGNLLYASWYGTPTLGNPRMLIRMNLTDPWPITSWDTLLSSTEDTCHTIEALTYAHGFIWSTNNYARMVQISLDPPSYVNCFPVPNVGSGAEGLTWDGHNIWYHNNATQKIYRIMAFDSVSSHATALGPLDSRPPVVNLICPPDTVRLGETVLFQWSVDDLFWANDECTLFIEYCGLIDTIIVTDTFHYWLAPIIPCDTEIMRIRVAVRDSFCNWGGDSCIAYLHLNNPPYAYFVHPDSGSITACNPDSIVLHFWDPDDAIDPTTCTLSVNDVLYDVSMPLFNYSDDSVFVFYPPSADFWSSGDTVWCAIISGYDPVGEPIPDLPIEWSFIVDYEPPLIVHYEPSHGEELYEMPDTAVLALFDLVSGIDTSSFLITVNGTLVELWRGSWLDDTDLDSVFNLIIPISAEACIGYEETCFVEICVHNIQDMPDYCAPNDTSLCWSFSIIRSGPTPAIIFPTPGSYIACRDSSIIIRLIESVAPIDPASIRLTVNGITYSIDSDMLDIIDDEWLVFRPGSDFWTDETTYLVSLDSLTDIFGNSSGVALPLSWEFYTDFSPPVFWEPFPPDDSRVGVESPDISTYIADSITGVDPSSIVLTINDSFSFGVGHPCLSFSVETGLLEFSTDCADIAFEDMDTVIVCIEAGDLPDHCDPNVGEFCWSFYITLSPPEPVIVSYLPGSWVACDTTEQAVIIAIHSREGVDTTTIELQVADSVFYWGDGEIEWMDDSLLVFTPLSARTYFADAETIFVCLLSVADTFGNFLGDTLCWSFMMDLSPPEIWEPVPLPDTLINDSLALISARLWDELSGIDTSTIIMILQGDTITLDDSCLVWSFDDSLLTFDIACRGESWNDGDTVVVRIITCDSPDYCDANCAELEWLFYVRLMGPTASIITPLDGQITACADQCIQIWLADDFEGVDDTTIVLVINETDTFTVHSPMLDYSAGDSLLEFCPDSALWRYWANEEDVRVELIAAYDRLGNPLSTPLDWSFAVDLEPPVASSILPLPGDTLATLLPAIEFDLTDNLAGVDPSSIIVTMNGYIYTVDSAGVSWDGTHLFVESSVMYSGGDSVIACIQASDNPDLCDANAMDTCWVFYIKTGGPIARIVRPFRYATSACEDEYIEFTVEHDNGIIDTSLHFWVTRSSDFADTSYLRYDSPGVSYTYIPLPDHRATVRYTPDLAFFDPETIFVCVTDCLDSLLNPMESPLCWRFYMDQNPPELWAEIPATGDIITERSPEISFKLFDFIAGLDTASVTVRIVSEFTDRVFTLSDTCLSWTPAESLFTLSTECAGIDFVCGEEISVFVEAADNTDYCCCNVGSYATTFSVAEGGPVAGIVRPLPDSVSSCVMEYIAIELSGEHGVDTSSIVLIVDGDTISWGDPRLSYDIGAEMLYFIPSPIFADDATMRVELFEAFDFLGCNLELPLDWTFHIDRIPPRLWSLEPAPDASIGHPSPMIRIRAFDDHSGINPDSVVITVDGVDYRLEHGAFEMIGDSLFRFNPATDGIRWSGGDTVCVSMRVFDNAHSYYGIGDYDGVECPPNYNDTTWCFEITPGGPVADYLYPFEGAWVGICHEDSVYMTLQAFDLARTVIDTSIQVWVSRPDIPFETIYTLSDPEISYDGSLNLIWYPDPDFIDGETVMISIIRAWDDLANELENHDTLTFRIDRSPPILLGHTPDLDEVIDDIAPEICFEIQDLLSGIATTSIVLTINGADYAFAHPATSWDGSVLCFDPEIAGVRWFGGDTVMVSLMVGDRPDICDTNFAVFDFHFAIEHGGPVANWVRPEPGAWSACEDEVILATIEDPQGIFDTTIIVEVTRNAGTAEEETVVYTVEDDGEFFWSYPDLRISPAVAFANGESVYVCIVSAEDSLSNPLSVPVCWGFNMDLEPPQFWNPIPPDGEELFVRTAPISIKLHDYLTGIDPSSIVLHFENMRTGELVFHIENDGLDYSVTDSLLSLDPLIAGIVWRGGDTICITVSAHDSPSDTTTGFSLDYCEPNESSYRWCFTIAPGGPVADNIRPMDDSYSSCIDEHIVVYIHDGGVGVGVDISTLRMSINAENITWGDPRLEFENDTLYYYPDTEFVNGATYLVRITYLEDYLGNYSRDLLEWSFTIDRTPPVFFVEEPLLEPYDPTAFWMTNNQEQPILIRIEESGGGLLERNIILTIYDTLVYTTDQLDFNYRPAEGYATILFDPVAQGVRFVAGDTVFFTIEASDTVDYCDHNYNSAYYQFLMEPSVTCYIHPNPFSPNDDGFNDIVVFDYPGMVSEPAELIIFNSRQQLVYRSNIGPVSELAYYTERMWDGRDNRGKMMLPGLYIYLILKDGEVVCEGTVVLMR